MTTEELEELIKETFEHLEQGRYRMALTSAKRLYEEDPENFRTAICLAWAEMENGNPAEALELANLAVKISSDNIMSRSYRGYLLTRMSIYDGALSDLDYVLNNKTPLPELAVKSKVRVLAGTNKFKEAQQVLQDALISIPSSRESFQYLLSLLKIVSGSAKAIKAQDFYDIAREAFRYKEYWFSYWAANYIGSHQTTSTLLKKAHLMELDSLYHMFRLKEALLRAENLKEIYTNDDEFESIYHKILIKSSDGNEPFSKPVIKLNGRSDLEIYTRHIYKIHSVKTFNFLNKIRDEKKVYLLQFNEDSIRYIGVEIVINNPFFNKRTIDIDGMAVWYLNDSEIGRNRFILGLEKEWKLVEFIQNWGNNLPGFWTPGQGSVDIYLEDKKICTRYFLIGKSQVINFEKGLQLEAFEETTPDISNITKTDSPSEGTSSPAANQKAQIDERSLKTALDDLNKLTGIENVKKEINEIVKLARFFIEQEENAEDKFTSHFVFMGNPGTGKTTVARLFSRIYRALGILPKGHLVETDRQGLVGMYIGETAQKTKDIIDKAIGGTLFIDEAYTLSRNSSNDFGNEAIETLLKRMEDDRGKFLVITAGYPDKMNSFLESNPGIKSRFTRKILFEDFSPDELLTIIENSVKEKGYIINPEAYEFLFKYCNKIYRERDENFGNGRIIRDSVDLMLKTHILHIADLPPGKRAELNLKEITLEDVSEIVSSSIRKTKPEIKGDNQLLDEYLKELQGLAGLKSVKDSVKKLVSSLKVAKLREEKGLKVIPKNLHSVFMGNPGTGKTTIARLLSRIYKEMGVLEKGHLIEVDRSGLVAGYSGQTALKTDSVIQRAIGGTLFIDEAYSLTRSQNEFGQEAIDTLLKKMEDYQGKFAVIVAGYTNEMKEFIETNPGLKSRFTNYYNFEDYTPRQLLEIALSITEKHNYVLDEGAWQLMLDICTELYNKRTTNFGNARMIRNILYKAISNQEERILTLYSPDAEDLSTITFEDVKNISLNDL